jgi:hypothetical protein
MASFSILRKTQQWRFQMARNVPKPASAAAFFDATITTDNNKV